MSSGSVYRRNGAWTAHVSWTDDEGKRRQRKRGGHRTKADAEVALRRLLAEVDLGYAVAPDALTVDTWLDRWLDHLQHVVHRKASTVAGYRSTLATYARPAFGKQRLQKLRADDLDRLYASMAGKGLSPRTIRYTHTIVRKALADAEHAGLVASNVADRARPPAAGATRAPKPTTWTLAELASFLRYIDGRGQSAAITFAALTGARRGEVLGLAWADVDLEGATARIRQAVVRAGRDVVFTTPKSDRERTIALDPDVVEVLRRHRREQAAWRLQVGDRWQDRDLVFPAPDGSPGNPDGLSQQFERLVKASGLPRIRLHDLRHGHGTALVAGGEDPKLLSERLGHATVSFTLNVYVHPSAEQQAAAVGRLAERLREAR